MSFVPILLGKFITKNDSVLDIGCGIGNHLKGVEAAHIEGVDAYDYSAKYPYKLTIGEVPDCLKEIPGDSFDVVIACDLIEHLDKIKGWKLIKEMERIARRNVFFLTPKEWHTNEKNTNDPRCWAYGNKYNIHKSHWLVEDFEQMDYEITPDQVYIFALKKIQ